LQPPGYIFLSLRLENGSQMLHGAGIFTYIWAILGVFMYVNIPAPWFASGDGFREHVNTLNGKSRIWRACCEAESRQILPLDVHDELKQGAFPEITCLLST